LLQQRREGWNEVGNKMDIIKNTLSADSTYAPVIDFNGLQFMKNDATLGACRGKVYFFSYDEHEGKDDPVQFQTYTGGDFGDAKELFFGDYYKVT
jgi:hypothetical protein